ncbi:DNA primase [Acidipila sp. EB88]|uniref:DNA primase n=1 Tax=Acidipila sp. EB88 TaxID=2305226 RepID=UPI000F5D9455|nr:DNA primase [Acidipila sp. EB88]RRA48536.1 DNA primase [Acidipila sp. EB88]
MPDDFAQLVKAQADIVKIVGEHVRLRKAGAQNWSGLCPFHSEKSGSFSVHAARQFFHCFGCGVSGDVFTFIQKIENCSFPEAVKIVALKMGISLPKREFASPEEAQEHRERARLIELHEQTSAFFEQQLQTPEGSAAREYLAGRGLGTDGLTKFRIGYAPDSSSALRQHLERLANPEHVRSGAFAQQLRLAGLFTAKEQEDGSQGPLYPRFRKRITFPIANEGGRVIAFTARALESGDKAGPKYLNSPETPLYSKGQVLFNLHQARQPIRQLNFALLVEGQMDCISVSLSGIQNVLATSGTAFTEAQVRLLGRYTKRVIVNFDPDTAGANAAEKSIALLTEEGFEVRVVTLEDGLDPDRYVRERGLPAYTAAVRGARRHSEYLLDRARQLHPPSTAEGKIQALNYLLPHIRRMPNAISREEFANEASHRLGIDSALVREELKQAAAGRKPALAASGPKLSEAERELLRAAAAETHSPAFLAVAAALDGRPEHFAALAAVETLRLLRHRPAGGDALQSLPEGPEKTLLAEVLFAEGQQPIELGSAEAALRSIECSALEREQRSVRVALADAERRNDEEQILLLMARKQQLERSLRAL